MSVLYLVTAPAPVIEGTDATFQEVAALKAAFAGQLVNLCPSGLGTRFPPQLLGWHKLWEIRRAERQCRITHLFHPVPYRFPLLRLLSNPIVYTVTASLGGLARPRQSEWLENLYRIVVSNPRDAEILRSWGLSNYAIVPPAIDATRITRGALPLGDEITLLMASAPWVEEQFDLKGVDDLLEAAAQMAKVKLIFLWRGLLLDQLRERIAQRGMVDRVEVVADRVEINDYLKRAHAAILPAKRSDIVKAYPHSLLESLAAGKPVILSAALPMADFVREHRCGIVLEEVTGRSLVEAIASLRAGYETLAKNARLTNISRIFAQDAMIEAYRAVYRL
jgi:glycosyltransferase involved in cell wall biosynthesis